MKKVLFLFLAIFFAMNAMKHNSYKTKKFRRMVLKLKDRSDERQIKTNELKEFLNNPQDWPPRLWFASAVRSLIDQGADANCQDRRGKTPIMIALDSLDLGLIYCLLDKGANAYQLTRLARSHTLIYALTRNEPCVNIVRSLARAGCNLNDRDSFGKSALYYAIHYGHAQEAELLIDAGADPEQKIDQNNAYQASAALEQLNVAGQVRPKRPQSSFFTSIGPKQKLS